MASLNTDKDSVEDVLEKLKSGRRPAATLITQAESVYSKLKIELQLYKDEIIEIKKVKNVEVPKEEPVQEQTSNTEIYKMMEASARHTAENEQLKEEMKTARTEKEHILKQIDDLKEQIERLEDKHCKENGPNDISSVTDGKLEREQSEINVSHDKENNSRNGMPGRETKLHDKGNKLHHKGEDLIDIDKDKSEEAHNKIINSQDTTPVSIEKKNNLQYHIEDGRNTTRSLKDEETDVSGKEKDLFPKEEEEEETNNWSNLLKDKEKDLLDMENRLHDFEDDLNKQKEENRRLQLKITNLNQDLKVQQKLIIDKERQVQTLEDDLHTITDDNNKLKSDNSRLKTEIDSLNHIRKELIHKQNEKEVHTVAVFGSSILDENRKLKSENEHLRGELIHANEKVHRHYKQLNEMTVKRDSSRHNEDLKTEMNELRLENIKLRHDVKKLLLKVENAKHDREKHMEYDENSYSNDQLPRLDGGHKQEMKELQEENRVLRHDVKQLKQDVAYAKHDRDQQRKQEEIAHNKALKYKGENKKLMQEKERLNDQKASLEHDLQRAKDKLELILGERNKEKENRNAMSYGGNGFTLHKDYRYPGGHSMTLESELKATKDQLQMLHEERKRDQQKVSSYPDDYHSLKKDIAKLEQINMKQERELKIAQAKLQHVQEERDRRKPSPAKSIEDEYSEHIGKQRLHRMKRGLDSESRATNDSMRKLSESTYDKRENDSSSQRVEDFRRVIERQKDQIKMLSNENRTLQNDVHDVRNRLSVLAGHKLMADNPNIADLSDGYRPTNISEKFRELYDNEWTQAYEDLEKKFRNDETQIIDTLVSVLKKVEVFCVEASSHQFVSLKIAIENELTYPKYKLENGTVMAGKHRAEMSSSQKETEDKFLKDLRKSFGILSTGPLAQIFHEVYMTKELGFEEASSGLKAFVVQSVKLVWMMKMQTPPMGLIWAHPKQNVDTNRFTFYTKRGDVIKQCVWPGLELHKNGPLTSKGVVQAM